MKRTILYCLLLALLPGPACKKTYEGGPVISLRSKMNRITGKLLRWNISLFPVLLLRTYMVMYRTTKDESCNTCGVYYLKLLIGLNIIKK